MEARLARLEDFAVDARLRLAKIEVRLEQMATKEDVGTLQVEVQKGNAELIKWIIGVAVAMVAIGITIMTFVLNNAIPKASPASQPMQPIVIYASPGQVTPQPAPPAKSP